jgi:hypothetical protein
MSDSELEEDDFIHVLDIEDPVVVETSVAVKRWNFHFWIHPFEASEQIVRR